MIAGILGIDGMRFRGLPFDLKPVGGAKMALTLTC